MYGTGKLSVFRFADQPGANHKAMFYLICDIISYVGAMGTDSVNWPVNLKWVFVVYLGY